MKAAPSRLVFNNTSMLDVIFIVLIFFISVSRLREGWLEIKLPEARATEARSARPGSNALIISINGEDRLLVNRRPLGAVDEVAAVARAYRESAGPEAPVIFVADRGSRSGTLVAAIKAVSDAGLRRITFSYEPRKEDRR